MQYNSNLVLSSALKRFLAPELINHVQDSLTLLAHFEEPDHRSSFHDYAFLVFPMAKAYEGFLKRFFLELGVMNEKHFRSRHFRIGRSFNPDFPHRLKDDVWVYDDVLNFCGADTARALWEMWIEGRNHTFHYFPDNRHCLSYAQAKRLIHRFLESMEMATQCQRG